MRRREFLKHVAIGSLVAGAAPKLAIGASGYGGELVVGGYADPLTFDPYKAGNVWGRLLARNIFDSLLTIDNQGKLAPGLAKSWEQTSPTTYVLSLRKNVKFHDGTPFDAEAVKLDMDRIRDPKLGSLRASEVATLDTVDVIDPHTVRFNLKQPFAAFLYPLADVAGCISSPAAIQKSGAEYGLNPAGTGPFKLVSYSKDTKVVLERNPDYWDQGRPYLDHVIYRPIPTDSTRLAALRSGDIHVAEQLPLQDISRIKAMPEVIVSERVGFRWEFFAFNLREAFPGSNQALRSALQWTLDREALHQVAYFGTGQIGYDGILPSSPYFDPNYRPFTRDMDKAKKLLDESGLGSVTIKAPLTPDPTKQRAAQVLQASLAELGVALEIQQADPAGYRTTLYSGTLPFDLQGWWGYRADPDQYLSILLPTYGKYAKNYGYVNPEMDKLFAAERTAQSEDERYKLFRKISETMNKDACIIPWHYSSDFKGLSPKVKGFVHRPDGITLFRDMQISS